VRSLAAGTRLYCCASGVFVGGPLQSGDAITLTRIQPRARRLYFTMETTGQAWWFSAEFVARYDLRTSPPDNPISEGERAMARRVAKALP
jgi:hypothetical protein